MKNWLHIILLLAAMLLVCSCEDRSPSDKPQTQPQPPAGKVLLGEPMELVRVELTPEAFAVWRQNSDRQPTLLFLSNDLLMQPVPKPLRPQVDALIKKTPTVELAARGSRRRADPLFLPDMSLDVAIWAGFFRRVIWVTPQSVEVTAEKLAAFQKQLVDAGLATEKEAATLRQQGQLAAVQLRGTELLVGSLSQLEQLEEPVVVHIDPSYFEQQYRNEIKTPLLPIIYTTLKNLQKLKAKALTVSFAHANLENRISLDVRFIGEILANLIDNPALLDEPPSKIWRQQAEILYLTNFTQKDEILTIARSMAQTVPQSGWVQFSLYRALQERGLGTEALKTLAEAVRFDPLYALEYELLADQAYDRGRPDAALQMLKLAQNNFPDNPHLKLKIAQLANDLGDRQTALELARSLQSLNWSAVYFPQMPQYLEGFVKHLEQ